MTEEELEAGLASDVSEAAAAGDGRVLTAILKNAMIRYALSRGATLEWCSTLRRLDWLEVTKVVDVCYGLPEESK